MKRSDLKYLVAYIAPVFCWAGLYYREWVSPGMLYLALLAIPIVELFLSSTPDRGIVNEVEREKLQLPIGYPAAIILSIIAPLWFKRINPLIRDTEYYALHKL